MTKKMNPNDLYARTTLVMEPALKARAERAAKLHGVSMAAMVRRMIEVGLPYWEKFDDGRKAMRKSLPDAA